MTLAANEFIRRFLIHVLPDGFHRIRHYGLFANANRATNIALARRLLGAPDPASSSRDSNGTENPHQDSEGNTCPCCGGRMVIIETFEPGRQPRQWPIPSIGSTVHDHHTPLAISHHRFRATLLSHRHRPRFADSDRQRRLRPANPAASNTRSPGRSRPGRALKVGAGEGRPGFLAQLRAASLVLKRDTGGQKNNAPNRYSTGKDRV